MLYKMDDTTFGGNIPSLPQWTGAPRGIIHVQAMLYASFAASLFSAFLAVLGKQWLNRYASTDVRGTGIERSQDRQRKLDGIITWYFDHVMESLPLMLQVALLLLGCALSLYLWEIDVTVACVVLSVTTLGVIFYAFIVVVGTAFTSCPYQTPVARILRYIHHRILRHTLPTTLGLLRSAFYDLVYESKCLGPFERSYRWLGRRQKISFLLKYILSFPLYLVLDAFQLAWALVRAPIALARKIFNWIRSARLAQACRTDQQVATLDLQCISWILRTSLEKSIHLSTLGFLATIPTLVDLSPLFIPKYFDIFIDCVKVNGRIGVIAQGMEQFAEASATCFSLAFCHLAIMDPMSSILTDIRQHYRRIFPCDFDLSGLPLPHILGPIHRKVHGYEASPPTEFPGYKPTYHEHIAGRTLSKLCWSKCQGGQAPYLCVSFALRFLSQDPLPPPSVIADCLLIIVMSMGWDVPKIMVSGERCAHT